jgi:5-methylcytosine-specific restriction endonuclease McrBC GTP-binding regulatory subunit McrB
VWLNQGPISSEKLPKIGEIGTISGPQTIFELKDERKDVLMSVLLEDTTSNQFFILRHEPKSQWDDIDVSSSKNKYHFGRKVPNHKKIRDAGVGTKTIWFTKQSGRYYFWGYGTVKAIEEIEKNKRWYLVYDDFKLFKKQDDSIEIDGKFLKPGNNFIQNEIENVENFNNQHSITKITKKIYEDITGEKVIMSTKAYESKTNNKLFDILERKNQLIFYGPPGTGKTFNAVALAKEFTKNNSLASQKMTFRSAAIKILKESGKPMHYTEISKIILDQGLVQTAGETPEFTVLKEMSKDIQNKGKNSIFEKTVKGTYQLNPNIEELELKTSEAFSGDRAPFVRSVTFHQSYSYEDFIEGIRPHSVDDQISYELKDGIFKEIVQDAKADTKNKYVLLIDEINRGNISKIFGELITLIEKDKRGKNPIQLAYSKEDFTVPPNLFIIGTMNTADKSLVQIDTALRRRFAFVELMTDYDLPGLNIQINGISLKTLLKKLNEKIRLKNLRDKQIGHSYFLGITKMNDLQFVFKYEIIPLLQDYFYEDYETIGEILGKKIVSLKDMTIDEKVIDDETQFKVELEKIINEK